MWIIDIFATTAAFIYFNIKSKKNTGSSLLTLTICDLTLHSWLFIEMQLSGIAFSEAALNEFMLVNSIKTQIL